MDNSPFFTLSTDEIEGRILVASKDIKAGEMILSELPLIKYPQWNSLPTCLGCYKLIDRENHILCQKCNFPMCSEACCKTSDHLLECRLFQLSDTCIADLMPDLNSGSSPIALYDIITPLRMLALRQQEDQGPWQQLCNLMSHKEEWDKLPAWREQHQHAIDYIMKTFKLPNVTEDLILELFGIAYINDFSALVGDARVRLAFPNAAMFSHDCAPNVVRHIENINHGHQIKCYAAKNIKKGERLSTTYVDLFLPGIIRRDILLKSKHFQCSCDKCNDPTELGSHGSSIRCAKKCKDGFMMPPAWQCNVCGHEISDQDGQALIFKAYKESDNLHSIKANRTVEKYENYLEEYGQLLHPNNLCLVRIKYTLVGFYGRIAGYRAPDLVAKPHLLDRKLELAKQVLAVLYRTEPGISSSKGVIFYEMHMPIFLKAQLGLNSGSIDQKTAKKEFEKSIKCIEDALFHLKYNSIGSFGHQLYVGGKTSLLQLQQFTKSIG